VIVERRHKITCKTGGNFRIIKLRGNRDRFFFDIALDLNQILEFPQPVPHIRNARLFFNSLFVRGLYQRNQFGYPGQRVQAESPLFPRLLLFIPLLAEQHRQQIIFLDDLFPQNVGV